MPDPGESSPHSFTPPRLHHAPGSGDGWVEDDEGRKFWGRFGAAGLLAFDAGRGILLQHRANWSHFGGTWGLPGGAKHESETPVQGAVREAGEEAGVPPGALRLKLTSVLDLGFWSYTTVVVDVTDSFDAAIGDAESIEMRWVPVDEVSSLPLHPGFAAAWPVLRAEVERPVVLVVDSANVVGARPDGWWKDRAAATERLAAALLRLSEHGFSAETLEIEPANTRWWPETLLVVEGKASDARHPAASGATTAGGENPSTSVDALDGTAPATAAELSGGVTIVRAPRDGDSQIVEVVRGAFAAASTPPRVYVVTADRELGGLVSGLGAQVRGPGWLWGLLDEAAAL